MLPSIKVDPPSRLIIVTLAEDTGDEDMYEFDAILRSMPEFVARYALLFDTRPANGIGVTEEGLGNLLNMTRNDKNFVAIIVADYQNFKRARVFEQGSNANLSTSDRVATFLNRESAVAWLQMQRGETTILEYLDSQERAIKGDPDEVDS